MLASRLQVLLLTAGVWGAATLAGLFSAGMPIAHAQAPQANQAAPRMVDVLIGFDRTPGPQERDLVRVRGGRVHRSFWLVPAIAASVPENALNGLANARSVMLVEPDGQFQAIDEDDPALIDEQWFTDELAYGWGVGHIGAGPLHAVNKMGGSVKVAIIDSGISEHLELNVAGGWNFINDTRFYADDNRHGTHVAGTVAAERNGFGVVGVAPAVELYALKVLDRNGGGSFSNIIAALEWCVVNNIDVTNNSYGSSANPGVVVQQAFDAAYHEAGMIHVAAAGNSGNPGGNNDTVEWPARYNSVIAVAATNQNDARASFSSSGPDVELSAPGVAIWSTFNDGGTWIQLSGTSMASPHVAGVAALVVAEGVDDPDMVRLILAGTAKPLGSANRYGAGLVQAYHAVAAVADGLDQPQDPPPPPADDEPEPPPPGKGNGKGNGKK